MSPILHVLKESLRTNFGPTVFLIVSGAIASLFIGYLIYDAIKTATENARRKKLHREERNVSHHH